MRIIRIIIPLILAAFLLMGAGDSFAQASNPLSSETIKNALKVENMSDYSKAHYSAIFGCPGNFFGGECMTTALGIVVGGFNTIALIMGTVVLGYIIIGGAINTAASGEILGKTWSSTWLPIRIAAAFGLILPVGSIAPYSPSQMATLYAVVIGDNMATSWVKEVAEKVGSREVSIGGQPPMVSPLITMDIAGSAFCAANEWNILTKYGKTRTRDVNIYTISSGSWPTRMKLSVTADAMPVTYRSIGNDAPSVIDFGHTGVCGSMDLPVPLNRSRLLSAMLSDDAAEKDAAFLAANTLILKKLTEFAKIESDMRTLGLTDKALEAADSMGPLSESHTEDINKLTMDLGRMAREFPGELLSETMKAYGTWDSKNFLQRDILHYTDINKLLHKLAVFSSAPIEAVQSVNVTMSNSKWDACLSFSDECKKTLSSKELKELNKGIRINTTMRGVQLIGKALNSEAGGSSAAASTEGNDTFEETKDPRKYLRMAVNAIKYSVIQSFSHYVKGGGGENEHMNFTLNPMVLFHNMSTTLVTASMAISTGMFLLGAVAHGAGSSLLGLGGAGAAIGLFEWLMAIVMPIFWAIVTLAGSFLLISFLPIVVGIWGYISIMMMAIQGVSAAPFAVVLLASPEGAGATNQTFQRFLLHWTHLMLAPMIFVLGAIASLALIVVGSNVVIWVFIKDMNFFGSDSWIIIIASLVIFLWILVQLVYKTAMFQISLQNDIMEIIGGAFHKPMGGNMTEDFQGATRGTGGMASSVSGSISSKGASMAKENNEKKAKEKEAKNPTIGGGGQV